MDTAKTAPPGGGYAPISEDVVVTNRSGSAVAVGDVVQFDFNGTQSETTTQLPYTAEGTSGYNNIVDPAAAEGVDGGAPIAVAVEAIADNATGKVRLKGVVQAFCVGTLVKGTSKLVCTTAKNFDATTNVAGEAFWARPLEDATLGATRTLAWVEFDGTSPLGFQET